MVHRVSAIGEQSGQGRKGAPVKVEIQIQKQHRVRAEGQEGVPHHQHVGSTRANVAQQQPRAFAPQSGVVDRQPDRPLRQSRETNGQKT